MMSGIGSTSYSCAFARTTVNTEWKQLHDNYARPLDISGAFGSLVTLTLNVQEPLDATRLLMVWNGSARMSD
jgi:hypothetical protein